MSTTELHTPVAASDVPLRHDWTRDEIRALFDLPLSELIFRAQGVHRINFDPSEVQLSTLLSIKTGGCPEDCAYCPQSAQYDTGVHAEKLMPLDQVLAEARAARDAGASRFCMGAAWRSPKARDLDQVCAMVEGVKALGLETCATLGMLTAPQAEKLKAAGLDYYNHNLDTSPEFYGRIITTRTYQDRLETLAHVRTAGIRVCCGGIVGMGETREDRIGMIVTLANLPAHPEIGADQYAGPRRRHAARGSAAARADRVRAHHRGCAHHHAAIDGAAIGRPRNHERRDAGAVFPRRRQFDLLRAKASHHAESQARPRSGADGSARFAADGGGTVTLKGSTRSAEPRRATAPGTSVDSSFERRCAAAAG